MEGRTQAHTHQCVATPCKAPGILSLLSSSWPLFFCVCSRYKIASSIVRHDGVCGRVASRLLAGTDIVSFHLAAAALHHRVRSFLRARAVLLQQTPKVLMGMNTASDSNDLCEQYRSIVRSARVIVMGGGQPNRGICRLTVTLDLALGYILIQST